LRCLVGGSAERLGLDRGFQFGLNGVGGVAPELARDVVCFMQRSQLCLHGGGEAVDDRQGLAVQTQILQRLAQQRHDAGLQVAGGFP
jgi:hypothetical protein